QHLLDALVLRGDPRIDPVSELVVARGPFLAQRAGCNGRFAPLMVRNADRGVIGPIARMPLGQRTHDESSGGDLRFHDDLDVAPVTFTTGGGDRRRRSPARRSRRTLRAPAP